jgi:hypothetical protein
MAIRVRVHDSWEGVGLEVDGATTVGQMKRQALTDARRPGDPDGYQVKFRGAALLEEAEPLASAGVVPNAELIVLPRRRQPVR